MWTVIYIAPSLRLAEKICEQLAAQGFLVKYRQSDASKQQYEILVPESELEDVRESWNVILHSSLSN
ncbi:glutamate decarboxylase [Sulfoacidibacillus thermotolerans]|uniref:Glutamate decarboxylase n=1 Tax=Sulfoacidibacillus thermotolerans TaxID=1765684 RepID=A0A2U3D9V7_SULT2|nr:glutamate decarboxylase [Sulfoacidibacillus thermotolerans]PWI58055.1 glutamate decarboxylase [Sulfoacidibacillus thermotolerans]